MATKPSKRQESTGRVAERGRRLRTPQPGSAVVPYKGSNSRGPRKVTQNVKEDILAVFVNLGGVTEMTKWAKDNKGVFYTKLFARLIPRDVTVSADEGLEDLLGQLADTRSSDAPAIEGDYVAVTHDD